MCKVFPSFTLEAKITAYVLPLVSTTCTVLLPLSAKERGGKQKLNYVLLRTPTLQKGCKSVNQDARASPPSPVCPHPVLTLAKAPLKAGGSPQTRAGQRNGNRNTGGSGMVTADRGVARPVSDQHLSWGWWEISLASSLGNIHPQPHFGTTLLFPRV